METFAMFDWATPHSHAASGNRRRRLVATISANLKSDEVEKERHASGDDVVSEKRSGLHICRTSDREERRHA